MKKWSGIVWHYIIVAVKETTQTMLMSKNTILILHNINSGFFHNFIGKVNEYILKIVFNILKS